MQPVTFCFFTWLLITAVILKEANGEEYLGCYKDADWPDRLLGHLKHFDNSLTPRVCITYCIGYAYAGVQDGVQCFCGDDTPEDSKKADEKDCDHSCAGDSSQICGGDWRDNIYKLENPIKASVAEFGYKYLGCYRDQANPRMLQGGFTDFGDFMTPMKCVQFCIDLGFHYAGVQYRTQCFCGDQVPLDKDRALEKECVARCTGDLTSICGGNWKSTVYATGLNKASAVANIGYKYEGCYRDLEDNRKLNSFIKNFGNELTPEACVSMCESYGYRYAGLQYRIECYCGDELLITDKRPDAECQNKCSGDTSKICGGPFRNTVYNTGTHIQASLATIGYQYLGCYKDQADPRNLQGFYKDFGLFMTPLGCVEYCKNLGYFYAAVEYSHQCFCGDQEVPSKKRLSDEKCNTKCIQDPFIICGGMWKHLLYATGLTQVATVANIGYKYEGCYRDNVETRKLNALKKDFGDNLVPEECVDLCKQKGYRFSGLQNRFECYCGDMDLLPADRVSDSDCQHKCSGDFSKICGGSSFNTVYSTGNSAKASIAITGLPYVGCYRDSDDRRRLKSEFKDFEDELTPESCIEYCKITGYRYAGLQNSQECYCGNDRPSDIDKRNDAECNTRCNGDSSKYCGGTLRNTIYNTNLPGTSPTRCETSFTTINGYKPTCKGQIVFFDSFSKSRISDKWSYVVQIGEEQNSEFVMYKNDDHLSFTKDGNLVIKPKILTNNFITGGRVMLTGCTGRVGTEQCEKQARAYLILPPVESARINSHNAFSFRYGRVDIRAKLPKGDWLVPDILLERKSNIYGSGDIYARIQISMSRGNEDLTSNGGDIGCKTLAVGIIVGEGSNAKQLTPLFINPECWHLQYHEFSVIWSQDKISFVVDGNEGSSIIRNEDGELCNSLDFNLRLIDLLENEEREAFDSDFYLTLGVSVGGAGNFPDGTVNRGRNKPWSNAELKRTLNFWRNRQYWESTWSNDSVLLVDYVKVTAL